MPDPGPGFSRLCPACGRRVPRSVAVCRCGAEVPELAGAGPPAQEPSRRGVTLVNLAAGMLLLGALAATGYRAFTRSPAAEPMARAVRRGGDAAFLPMPPEGGPPRSRSRRARRRRRAGVLPGVVRDALRTHRLEFDGWDR